MRNLVFVVFVVFVLLILGAKSLTAQQINLQTFDKLAANAANVVEVNLDGETLKFASAFMSGQDREEAAAQKVIAGLKGIYVRVFEFGRTGAYTPADIEQVRGQLKSPQWARSVTVRETNGDNVDVWMHREGENVTGLVVIVAEPEEVVVVNIVGPIRPEDLAALGGQFGIPKLGTEERN